MPRGPFLTLPNLISLARVPLALTAVWCFANQARLAAQILMIASFATDALDGAVARWTNTTSEWGRLLDPMADKMVFAVFAVFFAAVAVIPWWLVYAIVGRDLLVTIFGLLHMGDIGEVPSSNRLGKLSTVLLAVFMFEQAFWPAERVWFGLDAVGWIAVAALFVSTVGYAQVFWRHRGGAPA